VINWQQVAAYLLIIVGIAGVIVVAIVVAWKKYRTRKPAVIVQGADPVPVVRSADEPAPAGAVEWAADICSAMGTAPDSSKLAAILSGVTRDQARGLRIAELEATP